MWRNGIPASLVVALLCPLFATAVGCQTTVGGQALPSAYYLHDDVQYFPAGPEFKLTQQVQALEQYKLEQQKLKSGIDDEAQ
ncbi:MAG: hypothetical protein NT013_09615 [Planctomycetia bacterium]|nr:hypothetical protein [Planctomycetia bacterium]